MPEVTPNLGLKKPLGNETVSRAAYNENLDLIDQNVAKAVHGHDVATPNAAGFIAVSDKIKLDKIESVIITKSGVGSDGDYIDLSDLELSNVPHVIAFPADIPTFDPSQSNVSQKIKCWADNISQEGFTCHAQLVSIGQTTNHTVDTVLNSSGSYWESSLASSQNTTQIRIRLTARKEFYVYAQRSQGITQKWEIWYRPVGGAWALFDTYTHTQAHYNGSFLGGVSHKIFTDGFTYTIPLPPGQYEVKVVYVSEQTIPGGAGDIEWGGCYIRIDWWEETSDLQLATGNTSYISLREEEL
jgi:hypothetical protein